MSEGVTAADISAFTESGSDVQTTVFDFGDALIRRSTKDDLSILTISGVYSRGLGKEIERLSLQWRANLGLEFKDIKVNPSSQKKFDSSVIALLKTIQEKHQQRRTTFVLCTPPPELVDLLKLTGTYDDYDISSSADISAASAPMQSAGVDRGPRSRPPARPAPPPSQRVLVQKRILNLNQSLKRTVTLEKGLDSAAKCVRCFLPQAPPVAEGYSVAFAYKTSEKVGGDFFDFIALDQNLLGIVIGDVSGHGVDAAILMGITKKIINLRARSIANGSPREVLCQANADLIPDFHKYAFVTVLYGVLDLSTGRFTFARAGHEIPILFGPGPEQKAIVTRGMPMASDASQRFANSLEEACIEIPPGGSLFLCTDGLPESKNEKGQPYTREKLRYSISLVKSGLACRDVLDSILHSVNDHGGGRPQDDDITAILVQRLM